mmetsp:Transcript_19024/g.31530  ORF Transcript_19024/g.31530 Transcript_19024/m.31530 type:complete len:396 (-) Transcript_19024:12-1199(-)|eukprot:CAMPEP_0197727170 /NCGR_PEP_ID=MMETSP1434-20131217/18770_1 /TAXON_ID=265543 /ORGANISM="Minutocellus polymorphus, Strain CCMP3303" /LENGTH=395 /DNA_ID=CAMNT_0043313295 /DNA_START=46 /DNA_END=1233 /DNA_ORIENTATION=+
MASAKLQISSSSHSAEELSFILTDFATTSIRSSKQLFGGYSGSSYLINTPCPTADDQQATARYVLKVSNGYTYDDAEFMCRTARHLGAVGYLECCLPIPKMKQKRAPYTNDPYVYVSQRESNGIPAFLLNYVEGEQADKVMRDNPKLAPTVMRGIGGGLGRMHSTSVGLDKAKAISLGLRWYETDGGCCDVEDQVQDKILNKIMADPDARNHEFVAFYNRELNDLKKEMQLVKDGRLALGITHGDPFADNILSHPESGELSAFIDIEDVCVGPLLFDLACCAIGCVFKQSDKEEDGCDLGRKYSQVVDFTLLSALLDGYCADRKLPALETEHFVAFMQLSLLCNASWRFVKFNIVEKHNSIPDQVKNSYQELQQRIEYLHESVVKSNIQKLLDSI